MKFTPNQQHAIESRGKDLLISASAGTGKTAVLIERVYRLISEDGIDISRILVVTYTEKAARELKSRLASKLSLAIEEQPDKAHLLEEQLEKIEWSDISTIHSFCKKIAVQNFNISKIDPSARVLDEAERAILLNDAMEAVIREELNSSQPEAALFAYSNLTDTKKLRRLLFDLYEKAASYDEPRFFFEKMLAVSQESPLSTSLLSLALRMTQKYKARKLENKLMDFDDMQYYALAALEDEAVRASYRDAYDYVFVDEYQDTSFVQDRLIGFIAKPASLFIVGDYKQSIYGFRNARPELFLQKYSSYQGAANAECIRLNENFRSEIQVIDAVNEVFSKIMTKDFGGLDYTAEAQLIFPEKEGAALSSSSDIGQDKRSRINFIDKDDGREDGAHPQEDYAYFCLIRRIQDLKEQYGYSYDDICVLMRSPNTDARRIKRLFEEQGLSLSIDIDDDVLLFPEIKTLMDYLKIAVNPFDDEALIATLRSPIGRMDDDELFELSQVKKELRLSYYADFFDILDDVVLLNEELLSKLRLFYARLKRFRNDENTLLRDRLQTVIDEADYLHYLLGRRAKENLQASLFEFLDYIYEFEKANGSNIHLFVENYGDVLFSGKNLKGKPSVKQATESVKLLSIHKSKGLQFKLVILFGAEKDFTRTKPNEMEYRDYAFDEEGRLQLNLIEREKGVDRQNPLIEEAKLRHKYRERLEEQRLFYVALTRAEVKLEIMIRGREEEFKKNILDFEKAEANPGLAKSYADWLIYALDFSRVYDFDFSDKNKTLVFGNNWEFAVITAGTTTPKGGAEGAEDSPTEGDEEGLTFKEQVYPSIHLPIRRSVTSLKQGFKREDFDYHVSTLSKDATRRGTVYHSFMQHFVLNAGTVEEFLKLNEKRGYLSEEDLELIDMEKIRTFAYHPLFGRIKKAKKVWREKAFIYQTEIDGKKTQIQGIMDLAFLEKKSLVILDYKSDRLKRAEDFIALYKTQLDIYAEALTSITGLEVSQKLIYSFELGELIEI